MPYPINPWVMDSAHAHPMEVDGRPVCVRCSRRPDWAVTWTLNKSGYPGMGEARVEMACYRHLHAVCQGADNKPVMLTPYTGV